jgi:hypothetical protein
MRRWLGSFRTLFLAALVPSVVGWGLLVQWNAAGPGRFVRFWSWLAEKLAFPLLLRPATDPASAWVTDGSGARAVAGFAILIVVWCVMLALPLSVIAAWAAWFGRRLDPSRAFSGTWDPYATVPLALPAAPGRNALHLVTIPLALGWHILRRMWLPALGGFTVAWAARFIYLVAVMEHATPGGFLHLIGVLEQERRGRFALIGTAGAFPRHWSNQYTPARQLARQLAKNPLAFRAFVDDPFGQHAVFKLFALDAALYGVAAGLAAGVLVAFIRTIASLKP